MDTGDALTRQALAGFARFQIAVALLLFLPALSLRFWQAWLYCSLFAGSTLLITQYFLAHDRALVERRLAVGPVAETRKRQRIIQGVASVLVCLVFVVPGLERHVRPSRVPVWLVLVADALVIVAFAAIFLVFRENSHASAVVEVSPGQSVVSTGPYAVVRHPMYAAASLLFLATPLALGSLWALVPAVPLVAAMGARLLDEERYLAEHLPGYRAYRVRVRRRLVPYVW